MEVCGATAAHDERRSHDQGGGLFLRPVLAQEVGDGGVTDELDSWTPRTSDSEDP